MGHGQTQEGFDESFHSSSSSQLGKLRRGLWLGAAVGLGISAVSAKGSIENLLFVTVFMLLIFGPMDWYLRRRLKIAVVTIGHDAIESPIFSGKTKRYQWNDIAGVSVGSNQGAKYLQFQLAESVGQPDKRNFWTGANHARPAIPITSFEPEVQEKLLEAVNRRIRQSRADAGEEPETLTNPLVEEREFQERLKSFAPIPWITYLVIAINVLVWGIALVNGAGALQTPADMLLTWGGNAASEVQNGEWWRLLTATFLHGGFMHLFMNMLGLIGAGVVVERIYGHRLFVLIYLGSGLVGSALSLHFSAQHAVSVGASGAVFGVTGALLVGVFQHRDQLPRTFSKETVSTIGFFIVYSLMQGFARQGIDNAAHVGGLIGGCLLAFMLPERFNMERFTRDMKSRAIAGAAVVFAATASLAVMTPPATVDQKKAVEGEAALRRGMEGFQAALKAIEKDRKDVLAGKLTERESDERSRTVLAPMFKKVLQDMSMASLPPSDPRLPLFKETKRMSELLFESLEMQSVYKPGSDKPEPADPERAAAIEVELKEIVARVPQLVKNARRDGSAN